MLSIWQVSILGLVDKGLRHRFGKFEHILQLVSILGLVDKGLRQWLKYKSEARTISFNPWFSG